MITYDVAICVCTRRRPDGIIKLLESIEKIDVPEELRFKVVVVENDGFSRTKFNIDQFANNSNLDIEYYLETNPGISYARNRSVKEAKNAHLCCFVDDDQIVDREWLKKLLTCQQEYNADGVWGPNPPLFYRPVPSYVTYFHQPEIYSYGALVKQAYTNCLLLRRICLEQIEGPFDVRLNHTGGEDSYLTSRLVDMNYSIRFTPHAKAYELVPPERTTFNYMIRRTIRTINTKYIVNQLLNPDFPRYSILLTMILRMGKGFLIALPCLVFCKEKKFEGFIKIAHGWGGLLFLFGRKNTFYKN